MRHSAPRSISDTKKSIAIYQTLSGHSPLRRNPRTRTTTLTFPPGASILPRGVTLPSLERKEGVEAEDRTLRISAATPGISRGSSAISIKASLMSRIVCWNLCWEVEYMGRGGPCRGCLPYAIVDEVIDCDVGGAQANSTTMDN